MGPVPMAWLCRVKAMTDEDELFTLRAAAGLPPAYGPLNDAVLIVIDAQMEYTAEGALALPDIEPSLDNITALLLSGRKSGACLLYTSPSPRDS